jgi:hypothetical protein
VEQGGSEYTKCVPEPCMDIRVISRRGSNPTLTPPPPRPPDIPPKGLYTIFSLRQGSPRLGAQYTLVRRHPLRSKQGARAAPAGRRLPNQEGGVHCHPRRPFLVHLGIASHHRTNERMEPVLSVGAWPPHAPGPLLWGYGNHIHIFGKRTKKGTDTPPPLLGTSRPTESPMNGM